METAADTDVVLLASGLIFLWALLLGVWKYREMSKSPEGLAHPYIDQAHRAALLYSFATLLVAVFVELSDWSQLVDLICAGILIAYFASAILTYSILGARGETTNQFRPADRPHGLHPFMWSLIAGEIGAMLVLLAGFVSAQML